MGRYTEFNMNYLYLFIASVLSGVIGGMGLGGGGVLMLYLMSTGIAQHQAQGINLLFIVPAGVVALFFHIKNGYVSYSTLLPILLSGIIGVFWGSYIAESLDNEILRKMFAVLLIILGAREIFCGCKMMRKNKSAKNV